MPRVIADSHAVMVPERVFPQHQAALALVRERTQDPGVKTLRWLDLACGRGQILANIERVIPETRRKKIDYVGFDVSADYARAAEKAAESLFGRGRVQVCELQDFERLLEDQDLFDFITMTNTVHEVGPDGLAKTLVATLCRVTSTGCIFIYDMETLPELELGAIPWTGEEVEAVVHSMLSAAGVPPEALPDVAVWPHKSCQCWNLQLHRSHLSVDGFEGHRETMFEATATVIRELLEEKLVAINTGIDSAARFGIEDVEEREEVHRLLYDYWAISRALGLPFQPIIPGSTAEG